MKQLGHWRAEQLAVMLEGGCGGQLRLLPKPLLGPVTAKGDVGLSMTALAKDSTVSRA